MVHAMEQLVSRIPMLAEGEPLCLGDFCSVRRDCLRYQLVDEELESGRPVQNTLAGGPVKFPANCRYHTPA